MKVTDSCGTCYFSRTDTDGNMFCQCNAPNFKMLGPDWPGYPWARVFAAGWCGEGLDSTTGRPFGRTSPDVVTVANLPVNQQAGTRLFVSDSQNKNFGSSVSGGGSNLVPVYTDGLNNWFIG